MQHDTTYLTSAVAFAKEHFEHTVDIAARCRYSAETKIDEHGNDYQEEIAMFDLVTIIACSGKTKNGFTVIGLDGGAFSQRAEIDAVMLTYESCKPSLPTSDRRKTIAQ